MMKCVLIAILLLTVSPGLRQGESKVIEWSKSPKGSNTRTSADLLPLDQIEGIEIEGVFVEGKSIAIGKDFAAGDDWIQSITFRVKNISGQQLKAIQLTAILPEMSTGGPDIVFCYGCLKAEREKGIVAGEEVELKMPAGRYYGWVKDKITAQGSMSSISRAQIREMIVSLPDGTKWFSGCVKTADPKSTCPHSTP